MYMSTIDHCNALLAENGQLKQERDELAAQNQALRDSLVDTLYFLERNSNRWDGINGKHPFNIVESARAALALPGTAEILSARDARVLRDAAEICDEENKNWDRIDT